MSTTLETLQGLIARTQKLPPETLAPEASLESLGIDSLGLMELVFDLEDAFGIKVPSERATLSTVGDVVAWVDSLVAQQRGGEQAPATVATSGP